MIRGIFAHVAGILTLCDSVDAIFTHRVELAESVPVDGGTVVLHHVANSNAERVTFKIGKRR